MEDKETLHWPIKGKGQFMNLEEKKEIGCTAVIQIILCFPVHRKTVFAG